MALRDIPLEDLLQVAKKGTLEGTRLPAAVTAELRAAGAEARRAQALVLLGDVPAEVAKALAAVPQATAAKSDPVALARNAVAAAKLDAKAARRLTDALDRAGRAATLEPELPEPDPAQALLDRARLAEAVTAAGIGAEGANVVLARLSGPDDLGDQTIGTLVADGTLKEADGLRLGRTIGLARLLDDNTPAAAKLLETRFSAPVEDLPDLLDLPVDELAKAIGAADPALRKTARQRAEDMQGHLAETFPMRGITARLRQAAPLPPEMDFPKLAKALDGRAELWDGTEAAPDDVKTMLDSARALDRAWPGLGIGARLVKAEADGIAGDIAAAESFFRRNEEKSLLDLDLSPDSDDLKEIDFTDVPKELRPRLIDAVKARARAYHLAGETETTARLMASGVHTMQAAIDAGIDGLIDKGLARTQAERVVAAAHDRRTEVVATITALADGLRWEVGPGRRPPFAALLPDVTDGLRALPGYEDLFGDQSFCDCDHCGSILSPAAYFVDLMKWVDENVTAKVFTGAKVTHALRLSERRPDLWTLPLTCENTETLIPTLDVINEVLEAALAHAADPALPLTDRAAVLRKVYIDVLPGFIRSFVGPFDLRVARADRLLTSFEVDRLTLTDLVRPGAGALELAAAGLALPLAAAAEITTERSGWAHLEALFAQSFARTGDTVNAFDVQDLIAGMGTTRALLGDLAASRFVTPASAPGPRCPTPAPRRSISCSSGCASAWGWTMQPWSRCWWRWRPAWASTPPLRTRTTAASRSTRPTSRSSGGTRRSERGCRSHPPRWCWRPGSPTASPPSPRRRRRRGSSRSWMSYSASTCPCRSSPPPWTCRRRGCFWTPTALPPIWWRASARGRRCASPPPSSPSSPASARISPAPSSPPMPRSSTRCPTTCCG